MPVLVMKCISAEAHPDPKVTKMRMYKFWAHSFGILRAIQERQIVANLTNVYEVGDFAAIAITGSVVDGMLIEERELRGIISQGMALGKIEGHEDGEIVTELYSQCTL